jgi:predicted SPOUT superfamily RNA methylase MTH1
LALSGKKITVAIPDTVLEEKDSLRDKTAKLGLIARACAVYGVDEVVVFTDPGGRGEGDFVKKVLQYAETPQYLRRRLYPMDGALQFAGLLPPLRIPSHRPKVPVESLRVGELREGVVNNDGTVDIGLDMPAKFEGKAQAGARVTVRIQSKRPFVAVMTSKQEAIGYWGYTVRQGTVGELFGDRRGRLSVATSKLGRPLAGELPRLRESFVGAEAVELVFGSPSRGLFEIVGPDLEKQADFVLNLFPGQPVETVRTEEAMFAGLNLLNVLSAEKA